MAFENVDIVYHIFWIIHVYGCLIILLFYEDYLPVYDIYV